MVTFISMEIKTNCQTEHNYNFLIIIKFKRALSIERIYAILDKFDIDDGIGQGPEAGTYRIYAASDKAIAQLKTILKSHL